MKSEQRERITETLAAHLKRNITSCDCGWTELGKPHYGHLSAILAPVVDAMLAEARRDALDEAAKMWHHESQVAHTLRARAGQEAS